MNIILYHTNSDFIALDKNLELITNLSGNLRSESSIIDPVFIVEGNESHILNCNYVHIPDFGRYYFVRNIESLRTGLWRLTLHVDVLYTYRSQIRTNSGIIERNEHEYDLKLNDGLFVTQQNPRIAQYPFPRGFSQWNYVLAVAGN